MLHNLTGRIRHKIVVFGPWRFIPYRVCEVEDIAALNSAMGWKCAPNLKGFDFSEIRYPEDVNDRRIRDAEVLGAACKNGEWSILLEIGTSQGEGTSVMAQNAQRGIIYTVNILPEQVSRSGKMITSAPSRDEIGSIYCQKGFANIRQIFANTAEWEPDFGPIDVAFIDGCHDAKFVFNDTRKILKKCRPGSLILWHDFSPDLIRKHAWIADVCLGVERLYRDGYIHNKIFHLRNSWIGIYQVTEKDL